MRKTGRSRSSGAKSRVVAGLILLAMTASKPTSANDYSDGVAAFEAQDYVAAASIWQRAAEAGSADAKMQLGLLADLGLGMRRQPELAFRYYTEAATLGIPAAAFNVGVMLDSGTGVPRNSVAASVWYARAALSGSDRAAFNLGLLYRDGTGVAQNHDLAEYWLGMAASALPAATDASQRLAGAGVRNMEAPRPLSGDVFRPTELPVADLVWTSGPGPKGSLFAVQIVPVRPVAPTVPAFWMHQTTASAIQVPVPEGGLLWRVARIDPATAQYETSGWQAGIESSGLADPVGLISIVVATGDPRAASLARTLVQVLQGSGLVTRIMTITEPPEKSAIRYKYLNDAKFAGDLAHFLPGFTPDRVALSKDLSAGPGEVVITLAVVPSVAASP